MRFRAHAPGIFTQIFTIRGIFRGAAFPFVYALLPSKTERAYTTVLEVMLEKCRELRFPSPEPDTAVSDFELGIVNAVTTVFPFAVIRLCFSILDRACIGVCRRLSCRWPIGTRTTVL